MTDSVDSPVWTKRCQQIVEVSSAQPDADPVWVDITAYVLTVGSGQQAVIARGRQTELDRANPSQLTLALNNADGRFTPDNPLSPYVAWWKQGRRIRYREKLGPWVFDLFDGYIQLPEVVIQLPDVDQILNISAVDRIARLDQPGSEFVSTLYEYITSSGGDSLILYMPLNEQFGPNLTDVISGTSLNSYTSFVVGSQPTSWTPMATYGQANPLPGDELNGLTLTPLLDSTQNVAREIVFDNASTALFDTVTVNSGKTIALAVWVNVQSAPSTAYNGSVVNYYGPAGSYMTLVVGSTGTWVPGVEDFAASPVGSGGDRSVEVGVWRLIALRLTESSGLVEFWYHGSSPITYTISGASQAQFWGMQIRGEEPVALEHLQVYFGASATTYTRTAHLAQVAQGYDPLARQTTGQRVTTLLDYAGVPSGQRDIDPGTAVMDSASLASKTARTALAEAEATERGLLFTDGTGRVVFRDRIRRYNL